MHFHKSLLVLIFGCFFISGYSQNIWQAQHNSKRYVVKVNNNVVVNDTIYLSVLEQGYENIPLVIKQDGDSLSADNDSYGFKLKMLVLNNFGKSTLQPYNTTPFSLNFKKVDSVQPLYFPQHPKKPYPYVVEDVKFNGNSTGLTYGATLTLPKGKKKYPLAVLISGTGQHDRDYSYSGHHFFTVLADYLARKGIASFRVDDRGIGETTGDFSLATTLDFANDVSEAINYLRKRNDIDNSLLGLIGHSEGGMVASIETSRNKEVKYVISLSGVAVNGLKMLELQNAEILKGLHKSDGLLNKHMELFNEMFQTVYDSKKDDSLELKLEHTVGNWKQKQEKGTIEALNLHDGRDMNLIYRYARTAKTNWYRYMIHYNPEEFLSKIEVPVLALNGEMDIMVLAKENLNGFKKYLPKSTDLTTKIYPSLNHMYQHCVSCTNEEIPELDEVFSQVVLNDIAKWIKQHNK
ncbi:alpha/beta hydrolase [Aestuariibaculum sp. M13]|uniref:alpha/beta hydrolase n=1 Tax=Aestuariibaculum sp. M13 TaxID=2967132 RepID=UPI002159D80F|nr:alpha/beta fold hydrolase [Aestuariibaculum sp. M13]MCR8668964.1 alpha/beta hydrolase [Aestuariibaculum sp. M13]